MSCEACEVAVASPLSGRYEEACDQCVARRIARSPAAHRAIALQLGGDELIAEISRLLPKVELRAAKRMVWEWFQRSRGANP